MKKTTVLAGTHMAADMARIRAAVARRAKFDQRRFGTSAPRSKNKPPSAP